MRSVVELRQLSTVRARTACVFICSSRLVVDQVDSGSSAGLFDNSCVVVVIVGAEV